MSLLYYFERRYPNFLATVNMRGRVWPLYAIYMYGKNAASSHTLLLTGVDNGIRGYVAGQVRAYEAIERGEFLPTD